MKEKENRKGNSNIDKQTNQHRKREKKEAKEKSQMKKREKASRQEGRHQYTMKNRR